MAALVDFDILDEILIIQGKLKSFGLDGLIRINSQR
jgi:hypothetical protein